MVLNQSGQSVYLRKSGTAQKKEEYTFCGTYSFEHPRIEILKADKIAPTYFLVYEATVGDMVYFYGKVTGPDREKAENIMNKVPSVSKSVYSYEHKRATHYKIVPKNFPPAKIIEKEQQQLNIIRIFMKTLFVGGFILALPLLILAFFFQQGPLALAIFAVFLGVRIQSRVPSTKEITMASYDI